MNETNEILLSMRNITKVFPGVKALSDVSIDLRAGTVTALIGENGAGKSTLMKVLSGIYQDYSGKILLKGNEVAFQNPKHAQEIGVAIIHQELNLIPHMTVRENIFLGREMIMSRGFLDRKRMNREAKEILAKLKQSIDPSAQLGKLKVGQQQMVEIAKALMKDASIIIMDEPTSALSDGEVEQLFQVIEELKTSGKAIVYISHKMNEIFSISDEYVVLRDGHFIGSGKTTDVFEAELISKMIGRDYRISPGKKTSKSEQICLEVKSLSLNAETDFRLNSLKEINFTLNKGEILGIYGLMGAGRTELLESIFGLHYNLRSGEIKINDVNVILKSPEDAIRAGLALVPEDRKIDGLVLQMNIVRNTSLASLGNHQKFGLLDRSAEKKLAKKYVDELAVKTPSIFKRVSQLSGGNQQKLVIAKWLATDPGLILFDEPTRGIDINAKSEIYKLIHQLAAEGIGIILASSELPEVLTVSDRVLVMCEGKLTADFPIDEANEEKIMEAALPKN